MYKEHASFTPPPDDATLWRHLDFTKFVSLLDRQALFFPRADKLGDHFEGSYPVENLRLRAQAFDRVSPGALSNLARFTKNLARFTVISCWHWSTYESAAMWKIYSGERDGIAIKTDFSALKRSLTGDEDIFAGQVEYIDYNTDIIEGQQVLAPFLAKRKAFSHEHEVRAIHVPFLSQGMEPDLTQDIYEVGTYFEVDLALLVKEVVVAPYAEDWFVELVQSVAARYNLGAPIRRSSLADAPTWGDV